MTVEICPVCYGKGIVSNGFYSVPGQNWTTASMAPEKCKSCEGRGLVWK